MLPSRIGERALRLLRVMYERLDNEHGFVVPGAVALEAGLDTASSEYREALDYLLFHDYLERTRRSGIYKITDEGKGVAAEEGRS